jgi:hypothetical protein
MHQILGLFQQKNYAQPNQALRKITHAQNTTAASILAVAATGWLSTI